MLGSKLIKYFFLFFLRKGMPLLAISFGLLLFLHCESRTKVAAFQQNFPVPSAFRVLQCSLYGGAYTFWGSHLLTPFWESAVGTF